MEGFPDTFDRPGIQNDRSHCFQKSTPAPRWPDADTAIRGHLLIEAGSQEMKKQILISANDRQIQHLFIDNKLVVAERSNILAIDKKIRLVFEIS